MILDAPGAAAARHDRPHPAPARPRPPATLMKAQADLLAIRDGRVTSIARLRSQALNELSLLAESARRFRRGRAAAARGASTCSRSNIRNSIAVAAANARLAGFYARRGQTDEAHRALSRHRRHGRATARSPPTSPATCSRPISRCSPARSRTGRSWSTISSSPARRWSAPASPARRRCSRASSAPATTRPRACSASRSRSPARSSRPASRSRGSNALPEHRRRRARADRSAQPGARDAAGEPGRDPGASFPNSPTSARSRPRR